MEQHDKDDIRPEDLDLENFTTVDEVWTGDVDDGKFDLLRLWMYNFLLFCIILDADGINLAGNESPGLIGSDQIKLVEVNYCGICRVYLSRW